MADVHKLKDRLLKNLIMFNISETSPSRRAKFAMKIEPFEEEDFIIILEFYSEIDMIKIAPTILVDKNIREKYLEKNDTEKSEFIRPFAKCIRDRSFDAGISYNFGILEGSRFLIQQNMSQQTLLDTVVEGTFLLQDLGDLLSELDSTISVPGPNRDVFDRFA
ncbi:MAG: hypothetical protein OXC46_07455 [Thaumarchaeota archaeon]|nr:hypothetical protein [Nitrososphaerota archaeon]